MDGTALTTGVAGRSSLFNVTCNVNITSKKVRRHKSLDIAQSRDRTASGVLGFSTQAQQVWSSSPLLRIKGPS